MPDGFRRLLTGTLLSVFFLSSPCIGEEKIRQFSSLIEIHTDGGLTITEKITVLAEGDKIRRGIYRDFPTRYKDRSGKTKTVGFQLLDVKRDGKSEPFRLENLTNGVRVYIGRKDHFLPSGQYSYELIYQTDRQLGFFEDHDELYWNVTGNDWDFAIDQADATVRLPAGVATQHAEFTAYTGIKGETGRDYRLETLADGQARFEITRPLPPGSGFTIVAGWPKGFVAEPATHQRLSYFLEDNLALVVGFSGFFLVVLYFMYAWSRVGRDPARGTVFPRFEPPNDLSPASVRYIMRMGFDSRVFSTALISMAVKGRIRIEESESKKTIIHRDEVQDETPLSFGEQVIFKKLLANQESFELDKSQHKKIRSTRDAFKMRLEGEYHRHFFFKNRRWLIPGILISMLTIIAVVMTNSDPQTILGLGIPVLVMFVFLFAARSIWQQGRWFHAIIFGVIAIVSGLSNIAFALFSSNLIVVLILVLLVGVNFLFYALMKAPTRAGQKIIDEIEGFKKYLVTAEKNRLNTIGSVDEQLLLFEKYLPYALALDVDQEWSEKFSDVLDKAVASSEQNYRPSWYHGRSWNTRNPVGFAKSLSRSLSSTVVSAGTAPGSSSGFSGGSSGGGGGGGGGGGW
ncbi:MAG: DUF2207 domain-containing protein [Candidatus Thioglobus sp.]|nr:MAG: DUF2207 domain-containing protein [Candidatus Thioglobus sp.]